MNYDNRLRRLEEQAPSNAPLDLLVHFVDPQRGTVAALDMPSNTWFQREDVESSEQFIGRV